MSGADLDVVEAPEGAEATGSPEPRYLADVGAFETDPPAARPSGLLAELPDTARAEILDYAARAGIGPRDPELYLLLQALGYHMYTTGEAAKEARRSAEAATQRLEQAASDAAASIRTAGSSFAEELDTAMSAAAEQLQTTVLSAAGTAVQSSLRNVDLSPVLDRLAEHAEAARRRVWLLGTVALASIAVVGVAVAAAYAGWTLAERDEAMISRLKTSNQRYAQLMVCHQATPGQVVCRGPDGAQWAYKLGRAR